MVDLVARKVWSRRFLGLGDATSFFDYFGFRLGGRVSGWRVGASEGEGARLGFRWLDGREGAPDAGSCARPGFELLEAGPMQLGTWLCGDGYLQATLKRQNSGVEPGKAVFVATTRATVSPLSALCCRPVN